MKPEFEWSTRSKVEARWRTFYYAPGMGFETGNKVYVGRNDWNTEASAVEAQQRHEAGQIQTALPLRVAAWRSETVKNLQ